MKLIKCNKCGKETEIWYRVSACPMACPPITNFPRNMAENNFVKDYCEECFEKIKELLEDEPN